MRPTRRQFIQVSSAAAVGLMFTKARGVRAFFAQSPGLMLFKQPLPTLADMAPGVPVAAESYRGAGLRFPGVDYYEIAMRQFSQLLHPDLPAETTLWGYGNKADAAFRHLGGAIIANRDTAVRVRFFNQLPPSHFLPVDTSIPGAETGQAHNRVAAHLHGGHVPWPSDGGPFHWFTNGDTFTGPAMTGPSYTAWLPDTLGRLTADNWYPNHQSSRFMWYHDHAVGITRLNAYAGLATGYILRDHREDVLVKMGALPAREVPLVFQDKVFTMGGQLWYPDAYDTDFFDLEPGKVPPYPSVNPETWGDTILANGVVSPFLTVEPRRYRFRVLNACNTRFMSLRLLLAKGAGFPDNTEGDPARPGPAMQMIGTEGGFLDPVANRQGVFFSNAAGAPPLVLGPAERADLIIDFSDLNPGDVLILHNDAPVPFPEGTPLADFHPGNPDLASPPAPGFTPNTRSLLQFRVVPLAGAPDAKVPPGWRLPKLDPDPIAPSGVIAPPPGAFVRDLTLNEGVDEYGRLAPMLGTNVPLVSAAAGFGRGYLDAATETPQAGSVEVWRIFNLTPDAHPIHFHLANVQVLSRQPFDAENFTGDPVFIGAARPADPDEMGWKETVKMYAGECTTVVMRFDLPPDPRIPLLDPATGRFGQVQRVSVPESPRTGGLEYVWHCHILEHEEHDMMRPLVVMP